MEAMEERQVSQDGETRKLPDPFFVIATQNPVEQIGAYPLPESQLDRFLMAIEIGYPDPAAERDLLVSGDRRAHMSTLAALSDPPTLLEWQTRSGRRARLAGASRLRAGAARGHARQCRRRRRRRGASRAVAARGTSAARGGARLGAPRPGARWCCPRTCRRCSRRSPAIGSPAARARAPCRRRRCCAPSRCPRRAPGTARRAGAVAA